MKAALLGGPHAGKVREVRGLPSLIEDDPFYAPNRPDSWTTADCSRLWGRMTLPFRDLGISFFLHKHVRGELILDLGCGVGNAFLTSFGRVAGLDASLACLEHAAKLYDEVYHSGLKELPFADDTFDCVVSVDVMEHIPSDEKDAVIREMIRVTKPGGRLVHYLDCDSEKPLMRWAKSHPELYRRYHIEPPGHWGLEHASRSIARFRSLGLKPLREQTFDKTSLLYPEKYGWMFDNEYTTLSFKVRLLTSLSYRIRRFKPLRFLFDLLYLPYERITSALLPRDWAFSLGVVYEVTEEAKR